MRYIFLILFFLFTLTVIPVLVSNVLGSKMGILVFITIGLCWGLMNENRKSRFE